MFGETTKTLDDVNQWALKWDTRPPEGGDIIDENGAKKVIAEEKVKGKDKRFELILPLLV